MEFVNQSKTYRQAGHNVYSCQYHVLFCTKYRRKVMEGPIAEQFKSLVLEKQEEYGYVINSLDVASDHVHMLIEITPDESVSNVVTRIKSYTSHVLRNEHQVLRSRIPTLWTRVSMISSVGNLSLSDLEKFIEDQKNR